MTEAAKSNAATENITTTTTTEDLWMAGPTELRLTHLGVDLDVGAGVWVYAQEQHWISVYHSQYVCGDGHLHLWRDERGNWCVTSSGGWESFKQHPANGTGGEYPHITSSSPPNNKMYDVKYVVTWENRISSEQRATPVGFFQGGLVRFSIATPEQVLSCGMNI